MSIMELVGYVVLFAFATIALPMLWITWNDWANQKEWEEEHGE